MWFSKDLTFDFALNFLMVAHENQYRKSLINGEKIPYILHPIEVAQKLINIGITDTNVLISALLHDVIEENLSNKKYTKISIEKKFNKKIADIVEELTHYPDLISKEKYLENLASEGSDAAILIKILDRLCNVKDFILYNNSEYAVTYYKKASVIWNSFYIRAKESDSIFFEENLLYKKIDEETFDLESKLARI